MSRIIVLDNLRGFAFILMIIHHLFFFYNIKNEYYENIFIKIIGCISRYLFIFLVGYSLVNSYENNKKNFLYKRIKKSIEILIHAVIITLITYYYYPDMYVRFGILHFIGLITLLFAFIVPYNNLYYIMFIIFILLQYIKLSNINNVIDTILGNINYNTMDYFPIIKWVPIVLIGMICKDQNYNLEYLVNIDIFNNNNILTWLGQNSLNFYTIHMIILILIYNNFN